MLPTPRLAAALAAALLAAPRAASADEPAASAAPTWYRDVLPIVQERCQGCHRPGGVGPFALRTAEDAAAHAAMIAEVVEERRMPPWHADPAVGRFVNDRSLTPAQRATIVAWARGDQALGDPAHAPAPRTWASGWRMGEPDAVVSTPAPFRVAARGTVEYQYFNVPTDFGEDKWVSALEVQVDAPTVVHHVLVFVRYPRERGRSPEVKDGLAGYFASLLPGDAVLAFPEGTAKWLPQGSVLVFQVHYTPDGEERRDQPKLGLKFVPRERVEREFVTTSLHTTRFKIPPGAKGHVVEATKRFEHDTVLWGMTPHMHLRGESFRYVVELPDGSRRPLLTVPRYDFDWQTTYRLAEPMFLPAGSVVHGRATYDNSADNPWNPDPTREVRFGEQTHHEMMIGYLEVVTATPAERAAWERARAAGGAGK